MDIRRRISSCYKVARMTAFIDEDFKLIKKANQILVKLEKNPDKDFYILEIINILRTLLNVMEFNNLYLLMCEIVDMRYHEVLGYLFEEVDNLSNSNSGKVIRKFQEMSSQDEVESI